MRSGQAATSDYIPPSWQILVACVRSQVTARETRSQDGWLLRTQPPSQHGPKSAESLGAGGLEVAPYSAKSRASPIKSVLTALVLQPVVHVPSL